MALPVFPDVSTPIPSHQNHFWAPNAKPEPSGSVPSQLMSNASLNPLTPSHLSNALPNTLTPSHLANAFPTRHTFNLSSPSCQVDSQHPHSFPTRRLSTFTLLHQVYSWRLISLATAVGRCHRASDPFVNVRNILDHSAASSRQGPTQSDGCTKASDAFPDSRADVPIFGWSLLTVPNRTHAVTYQDRTASLGLALSSPDSLCSRELAKYKIQYLWLESLPPLESSRPPPLRIPDRAEGEPVDLWHLCRNCPAHRWSSSFLQCL